MAPRLSLPLAVLTTSAVILAQTKPVVREKLGAVTGEFKIHSYDLNARDTQRPIWSGGALVTFEKNGTANPVIHVFAENGLDSPTVFSIPRAESIQISQIAHAEDGAVALVGGTTDSQRHRAGFVSLIAPDRQSATTIRMSGYYRPVMVTVGVDGTIWTAGWESRDAAGYMKDPDAHVIRRFDRSG